MKDRCVGFVTVDEAGEAHVDRYPFREGPTLFSSMPQAKGVGFGNVLREVVVMDVATATELEEKAKMLGVLQEKVKRGGDYAVKCMNVVVLANEEGKVFSSGKGAQLEAYRHTEDAVKHLREVTNDKEPGKVQVLGAVLIDMLEWMDLQEKARECLTDEARAKLDAYDAIARMCVAPGTVPDPENVVQWVSDWKDAKGKSIEIGNMLNAAGYLPGVAGIASSVRSLIGNAKFAADLRATLNTLGCDDGVNVAEWLTDTVRGSNRFAQIETISRLHGWEDSRCNLPDWLGTKLTNAKAMEEARAVLDKEGYARLGSFAGLVGELVREAKAGRRLADAKVTEPVVGAKWTEHTSPAADCSDRDAAVKRITDTIARLTKQARGDPNNSATYYQTIATLETVLATYLH
ncbi:MAG: hypothetical protein WC683_18500 [bacterium]